MEDPLQKKGDYEMKGIMDSMKQEKLREIQNTIHFYQTAPYRDLISEAKHFDKNQVKQIEYSAFDKIKQYSSLEQDEKKFLKKKLRKGVFFNMGLLGVYKIMSNPQVFNINMKYFGKIVKILTFKKGVFLWFLSPMMAHYDYQEMVLRIGVKYWLIKQNHDLLFNKDNVSQIKNENINS